MATTAVFFETIIIGFQVILWIVLLLLSIFNVEWTAAIKEFDGDWAILGSALCIGLAYTLGLMSNRVAEEVFFLLLTKVEFLRKRYEFEERMNVKYLQVYIWTTDTNTADRLEVSFRECVLLRATALNILLICICGIILILTVWGFYWPLLVGVLSLSTLIVILVYWTWELALASYYRHLKTASNQLQQHSNPPNSPPQAS